MTRAAILVVSAALLIFPSATVAQEPDLTREDAANQINAVLSDPHNPYNVGAGAPITRLALETTISTAEDVETFKNRTLSKFIGPMPPPGMQGGSIYEGFNQAWHVGLIDHFDFKPVLINGNNNATGIDIVAVVKQDQTICQPEQMPSPDGLLLVCDIDTLHRSVDQITGITSMFDQGREVRIVEFNLRKVATDVGEKLFNYKSGTVRAKAYFVLYDDGWRVNPEIDELW
jgi:hypothetical protein